MPLDKYTHKFNQKPSYIALVLEVNVFSIGKGEGGNIQPIEKQDNRNIEEINAVFRESPCLE